MRTGAKLNALAGGDRRSLGLSDETVAVILAEPRRFGALIKGMFSEDPIIRMRSADAAEKISRTRPELLQAHKSMLLNDGVDIEQCEVRWHVAQMIPRLRLHHPEVESAAEILRSWLHDRSRIVQVNALEALVELASTNLELRNEVVAIVGQLKNAPSAAVRARARKLEGLMSRGWKTKAASAHD